MSYVLCLHLVSPSPSEWVKEQPVVALGYVRYDIKCTLYSSVELRLFWYHVSGLSQGFITFTLWNSVKFLWYFLSLYQSVVLVIGRKFQQFAGITQSQKFCFIWFIARQRRTGKILLGELNIICPNETCWSQMHKMILSWLQVFIAIPAGTKHRSQVTGHRSQVIVLPIQKVSQTPLKANLRPNKFLFRPN